MITFKSEKYNFSWKNDSYQLIPNEFDRTTNGFALENTRIDNEIEQDLLEWLSLYFNEDLVTPTRKDNREFTHIRGFYYFDYEHFISFLRIAEKFSIKVQAKWKKNAFGRVMKFHLSALRLGAKEFPVNISLIATAIELLSNIYERNKNSDYQTIGGKPMNRM